MFPHDDFLARGSCRSCGRAELRVSDLRSSVAGLHGSLAGLSLRGFLFFLRFLGKCFLIQQCTPQRLESIFCNNWKGSGGSQPI